MRSLKSGDGLNRGNFIGIGPRLTKHGDFVLPFTSVEGHFIVHTSYNLLLDTDQSAQLNSINLGLKSLLGGL